MATVIGNLGRGAKSMASSVANTAKGWLTGLGLMKTPSPLVKAAKVIYPECSMTHRSTGAIRLEDNDEA